MAFKLEEDSILETRIVPARTEPVRRITIKQFNDEIVELTQVIATHNTKRLGEVDLENKQAKLAELQAAKTEMGI